MRTKMRGLLSSKYFILILGVLVGAIVILGIRFATYKPEAKIHYHANFAVYINGKQEQFKDPSYYTEIESCADESEANMQPGERAHMHDEVNNVVHVEDHAVTWGQFFQNIGWNFGADYLINKNGTIYESGDTNLLHVVLDGQDYTGLDNLATRVIKDQDKLLLSYGNLSNAQVEQEYGAIPSTAHKYDVTQDPKSCSGHEEDDSMRARISHMF